MIVALSVALLALTVIVIRQQAVIRHILRTNSAQHQNLKAHADMLRIIGAKVFPGVRWTQTADAPEQGR